MYYSSFGFLAIILHLIVNHYVLKKPTDGSESTVKSRYRSFLYSLMIYYVADVLWGSLYELRIIPLVYIDTELYFASMVLSVLLWSRFVVSYLNSRNRFSNALTYAAWFIFTGEMVCLVVNLFIPILFMYDSTKEYRPASGRYVTLVVQVLLFFLTSVYTLYMMNKTEGKRKRHYKTIGLSGLIMTVFIILQTMYPLLPFYAIGCLIATCMIHAFIVQDEKLDFDVELGSAKHIAYTDALTGVKNSHAFAEARKHANQRIMNGTMNDFGLIVFDLNGLKQINDSLGHEEGDKYIKSSCNYICRQFKHSPVYRIGGDEFAILLEGDDYENREALLAAFENKIDQNREEGLAVVASGMAVYIPGEDRHFDSIFGRADLEMYERKRRLKEE